MFNFINTRAMERDGGGDEDVDDGLRARLRTTPSDGDNASFFSSCVDIVVVLEMKLWIGEMPPSR